jgi:aspartate/methionine/tyrosine aminotransferase
MKGLNDQLDSVRQSGTVALADRIRGLEAAGTKVIPLHTGDPDFDTPSFITNAAFAAIQKGQTHYGNSKGIPELRRAIAELQLEKGWQIHPEKQVLITAGGIHAYFLAVSSILNPGDEVIVPNPTWMSHKNIVSLAHGKAVDIELFEKDNFFYTRDQLDKALSASTKAVVVNFPSNPTGKIPTGEQLQMVVDFALKHDLYIISDEVYDHILFDGRKHRSIASFEGAQDRCLLVNSFSKTFAMTGWRIGYLCAPDHVVSNALKISQCTITNAVPFIQAAAHEALINPQSSAAIEKMRATYEYRRDTVLRKFEDAAIPGIKMPKPEGAFYFFIDIRSLGFKTSEDCANALLSEEFVAAVPGSVFGTAGEGYLRFTFASADQQVFEGMDRFINFCRRHQ